MIFITNIVLYITPVKLLKLTKLGFVKNEWHFETASRASAETKGRDRKISDSSRKKVSCPMGEKIIISILEVNCFS